MPVLLGSGSTGAIIIDASAAPYNVKAGDTSVATANQTGLTQAVADAVTQAQTTGTSSAIVEFPDGIYYFNGSLQTTGGAYALIPIPVIVSSGQMITLTFRSKGKPGTVTNVSGGANATGPVVLQSLFTGGVYSGTNGWPSFFGAADPLRMPSFSYSSPYLSWMHLAFEGIVFRQPANPSLCAVQASLVGQLSLRGCRWDTTDSSTTLTDYTTQPTHPTGIAYLPPNVNTAQGCVLEGNNWVVGHYGGFGLGEVFVNLGYALAFECIVGFNCVGPMAHACNVGDANPVNCPYDFAYVDPTAGVAPIPSQTLGGFAIIGTVDSQDGPNPGGGVAWTARAKHINDPSSVLTGQLTYLRTLAGFGNVQALINSGARRLTVRDWGAPSFITNGQGGSMLVVDNVRRANSSSSPGSPEHGGNGWTINGTAVWGVTGGRLQVVSGLSAGVSSSLATDAGVANCTVGFRPNGTGSGGPNLAVRVQDGTNQILVSGHDGGIYTLIAGTLTQVTAGTVTNGGGAMVVAVANGNTITSYVNEAQSATATIANFNTVTKHGVNMYGANGTCGSDFFIST